MSGTALKQDDLALCEFRASRSSSVRTKSSIVDGREFWIRKGPRSAIPYWRATSTCISGIKDVEGYFLSDDAAAALIMRIAATGSSSGR